MMNFNVTVRLRCIVCMFTFDANIFLIFSHVDPVYFEITDGCVSVEVNGSDVILQ